MSQRPNSQSTTQKPRTDTSKAHVKVPQPISSKALPGVSVDMRTLMGFRLGHSGQGAAKFKRSAHRKHGDALSVFKGRGMTFSEVRHYQPGDDARSIDWRVTARRGGQPHTKVFQEEREQPVYLVIDQRAHLFFGTQRCFKSVLACELGALFAWEALAVGDRTSHLVFTDNHIDHGPPRAGTRGVTHALQALVTANQSLLKPKAPLTEQNGAQQLLKALNTIHHLAKPGAHVIIISDFFGLCAPQAYQSIKQALSPLVRHTHTYGLFIYDQFESRLPAANQMLLSDGQNRFELDSSSAKLRSQYHSQFEHALGLTSGLFNELGCPLLLRGTHQETNTQVLGALTQARPHTPSPGGNP